MTQNITTTILHREVASGYIDCSFIIDAAGNMFIAGATGLAENTNITFVEVFKVAPNGPVPNEPQWKVTPTTPQKVDAVQLYYSGTDLRVVMATHEPGPAPRDMMIEQAVIPGVFVYEAGMQLESGGPGAFTGSGDPTPDPGPGGPPVDYDEVERRVEFIVRRELAALVGLFGSGSIRQALEDKTKDAIVEATNPANYDTDPRAHAYQDALYPFLKNAAAGPLANVLGGQDEWGQARQEELKQIIRDVLEEDALPAPAPITP